uniref:Putative secreted protein n=1 Tax=Ixodes ricinus TaxID=34613 RepID=A0A6B0V1X6_IXORI
MRVSSAAPRIPAVVLFLDLPGGSSLAPAGLVELGVDGAWKGSSLLSSEEDVSKMFSRSQSVTLRSSTLVKPGWRGVGGEPTPGRSPVEPGVAEPAREPPLGAPSFEPSLEPGSTAPHSGTGVTEPPVPELGVAAEPSSWPEVSMGTPSLSSSLGTSRAGCPGVPCSAARAAVAARPAASSSQSS